MDEPEIKKARPIIAVSVPQEVAEFYDKHPEINRSKVFQDASHSLMYPAMKKTSPQVILMMFMNFIVAMGIIFVSLWMPTQIASTDTMYLKLALIFLAFILTVVSLMTYRTEKQRTRKI